MKEDQREHPATIAQLLTEQWGVTPSMVDGADGKGLTAEEFYAMCPQRIPLAVQVAPTGARWSGRGCRLDIAGHFMALHWLLVNNRIRFFYSDAMDNVIPLIATTTATEWERQVFVQSVFSISARYTGYIRPYTFTEENPHATARAWLQSLRHNGENSCPVDVNIHSLLSVFHQGVLGSCGALVIPGPEKSREVRQSNVSVPFVTMHVLRWLRRRTC